MSVNELKQKKLINEFNRKLEGENPDTLQKNSNIPEDILKFQSIEGIVTDPENRTLWINGMPYGNAYAVASSTATENGPFHAEVFNDFETNTTESDYSHVEGQRNKIESGSTSSHAEGIGNTIYKDSIASHVEGIQNTVSGENSHSEGKNNTITGNCSHIEGNTNQLSSNYSHIEGSSNTSSTDANYSHVEGFGNKVTNEYEHAEGIYNFSVLYSGENGEDLLNDDNAIVSTVGVGKNDQNRKNAIRVNRDGAVYLGSVIKRTDTVTEVFDPCNYDGQQIYETSITNSSKKEVKSKSVQELLATINHSEKITYWRLLQLAQTNTLMPGKSYRITDYNPGLNKELNTIKIENETIELPQYILSSQTIEGVNNAVTISTNKENLNRFDIIVTAISESEISNIAKACPHDYYGNEEKKDYFVGTNFNDWILYYDLTNDNSKYPWVDTDSKQPTITILPISSSYLQKYCEGFFETKEDLGDFIQEENGLLSVYSTTYRDENGSYKYFGLTDKAKIKADYPYASEDGETVFKNFNTLRYNYAGEYFYRDDREKQFDNDYKTTVGEYTGTTPEPSLKTHVYNYKWLINIDADVEAKAYEFCLLTNEADFSYMKSNNGIQETNILFCKNDKSIDVTDYDKQVSIKDKNDEELKVGPYYNLSNNYPYVIQIERKVDDVLYYSAFIYDGPYNGNYGEIKNATQDRWYILENYDPSKNIYSVSKDDKGTQILLVNRKNEGDAPVDFSDWANSLKNALEEKDGNEVKYNTFIVSNRPLFIAENGTTFKEMANCGISVQDKVNENGETYKEYSLSLPKTKTDPNYTQPEGEPLKIEYYIKSDYTYKYEGSTYTVWQQTRTYGDEYSFIITNPNETEEITENNINEIILISCPIRNPEYYLTITNSDVLEYYIIDAQNSIGKDANGIGTYKTEDDKNGLKFPEGTYSRNPEKIVYQNERYYITYNLLAESFDYDNPNNYNQKRLKQYRVNIEYSLNMLYNKVSTTEFKPNFTYNVIFEENLLPISYALIDTSVPNGDYYTEGSYESTGVIYRMIDEFGNDCPYDFKNIKFLNNSVDISGTKVLHITSVGTYNDFNIGGPITITFGSNIIDQKLEYPGDDAENPAKLTLSYGPPCEVSYDKNGITVTDITNGSYIAARGLYITVPVDKDFSNANLSYSYTFDGVITNKISVERDVYETNSDGKYIDADGKELPNQNYPPEGGVLVYVDENNTIVKKETVEQEVLEPYKNIKCIGDFSLTGRCLNNKILYPKLSDNGINNTYFRLNIDSSLINNTFVDCNSCGSCLTGSTTTGSKTNMLNNIFKECNSLDINNYETLSNNYFYNFSNSILNAANNDSKIINSIIIDSTIIPENGEKINIIESKISDSTLTGLKSGNFVNSIIYQNTTDFNEQKSGENYNLISYDGIFFNKEFHKINADNNEFSLRSDPNILISSKNGFITIEPGAAIEDLPSTKLYSIKNTQTLSYNDSLYKYDDTDKTRDNKTVTNSVTFTYNFNKHTFTFNNDDTNEYYPKSGYGYTLPGSYFNEPEGTLISNHDAIDTNDSSHGPNYLFLGTFYTNCKWNIYTFWGQSNAVHGGASLKLNLSIKLNGISEPIKISDIIASDKKTNYWSERKWTTYAMCPYINIDKYFKDNATTINTKASSAISGLTLINTDTGAIKISEGGKLLVENIKFEFSAESWANSTGANNCVGDVWISWLCHYNSTSWNSTGVFTSAQTEKYNNSTIYYYKPNVYMQKGGTGNSPWIFGTNGIKYNGTLYKFTNAGVSV